METPLDAAAGSSGADGVAAAASGSNKHRRDSSVSIEGDARAAGIANGASQEEPPSKRVAQEDEKAKIKGSLASKTTAAAEAVTEHDVGIRVYVDETLVPIQGGIIKQRFSDFHVREVTQDGQVCRITSLEPSEIGGKDGDNSMSLLAQLRAELAERNDASGSIRQARLDREAQEKAAKDAERQAIAKRKYEWATISAEQQEKLQSLFGEQTAELKAMWEQGPRPGQRDTRTVTSIPIVNKDERRAAHQLVREAFEGLLVTSAVTPSIAAAQPASNGEAGQASALSARWDAAAGTVKQDRSAARNQQRPQPGQQRGAEDNLPPYIYFLLQKTNRDTQDALNMIARALGIMRQGGGHRGGSKAVTELSTAGTKDKRGITTQQVAFRRGRRTVDDVWRALNGISSGGRGGGRGGARFGRGIQPRTPMDAMTTRGERGLRAAHFTYGDKPLFLGGLGGNEFEIVLRNVKVTSRETIDKAIDVLKTKGFINYYGMQRFGTSIISTHTIGIALLQSDYCKAVDLIMSSRDGDIDVATEAREAYARGDLDTALQLFPNHCVPERSILSRMRGDRQLFTAGQHPRESTRADWHKYFAALPRTLRSMYVHAYQSYAWNCLASERVRRFGLDKVIVGDSILLPEEAKADTRDDVEVELDDDIAQMDLGDELGPSASSRKRAKIIETEDEAQQYTLHDVVIPLFGSDVVPPEGDSWMSNVYTETLSKDGLTPTDVARGGRNNTSADAFLRGDYRALLHRPRDVDYHLVRYTDPNVNLLQSDEDRLLGLDPAPPRVQDVDVAPLSTEQPSFLALVLRFTLGVSAYATMALREILKQETSMAHQRALTARGEDRVPQ